MAEARTAADEQAELWNGVAGQAWVESQELIDSLLKPIGDVLVETIPAGCAENILDVGCGTGATTIAIARRLGAKGECTGIDISEPMIAAARDRAEREGVPARFIRADAQTHAFAPARYDRIVSRFGVMFFGDPVQAFANLRHAASDGAKLCFAAWRSAAENPFMTVAERAAAALLPDIPAREKDAPGQFAFGDDGRVRRILQESGWSGVSIRPIDVACMMPTSDLVPYFTRLGPLGQVLGEVDEAKRARVIETVRVAFEPYVAGGKVRFDAACWMVEAVARAAEGALDQA